MLVSPSALLETRRLPRNVALLAAGAFAIAAMEAVSSANRTATSEELLQWLACAAGFLLIQGLSDHAARRLAWTLALAGLFEAGYGLYQVSSGDNHVLWKLKEAYAGFATGTYFNRNHLAGFLELAFGAQIGLFFAGFEAKKYGRASLAAAALAVSVAAFFKTGSRMGAASLAAGAFFFGMLAVRRRGPAWKILPVLLLVVAAISARGGFASRFLDPDAWEQSFTGRFAVWKDTLRMISEHPLRGTGLGTFEWVFPRYQSETLIQGWSHAHNDYLELAAEAGLPAFGALALGTGILFFSCVSGLRSAANPENFWPAAGLLAGALALLTHGLADFNFAIPANRFLFFFVLSLAWRLEGGAA